MVRKVVDLPLHQDSASTFLPWVIGLMIYVIMLTSTFALALSFYIHATTQTEFSQLTLEIPASLSQNRTQIERDALERLGHFPQIMSIRPVSSQQIQSTILPWLDPEKEGQNTLTTLPFPILIDIIFKKHITDEESDLVKELRQIFPDASLILHGELLEHLYEWLETLEWLAWGSAGIFLTVALLAVASAVRTGVAIHTPIMEILHLMGASEKYISRQFQQQTLKTTLKSLLLAGFLLVITFIFFQLFLEGAHFPFPFSSAFYQQLAVIFVAVPVISGALILLITRLAVIYSLRHLHF